MNIALLAKRGKPEDGGTVEEEEKSIGKRPVCNSGTFLSQSKKICCHSKCLQHRTAVSCRNVWSKNTHLF